jgi:hypothetical protein
MRATGLISLFSSSLDTIKKGLLERCGGSTIDKKGEKKSLCEASLTFGFF